MRSPSSGVAAAASFALLSACAWSNPDNRPVWNAFELHLVPQEGAEFYVSLPATVPLGVGAILADTLVVHPLQVVDDAARDVAVLWDPDRLDFARAYFTQLAALPVRAASTPVAFCGSWLGRSVFDVSPHEAALTDEEQREQEAQARREAEEAQRSAREARAVAFLRWLASGGARAPTAPRVEVWDASFDGALDRALAGDAGDRRTLHAGMLRAGVVRVGPYDATLGLSDPDPVVRFEVLSVWPASEPLPEAALQALLDDPVESVRLRAKLRSER